MSKITLSSVSSGYNLSVINSNFQKLATELNNKVLYRTGVSGEDNSMSTNIDMNGYRILNLPQPVYDTDILTYGTFKTTVDSMENSKNQAAIYTQQASGYADNSASSAATSAASAAAATASAENISALLNIGIGQAVIVDGELTMSYVDAQISTLVVVDGELQVSYT